MADEVDPKDFPPCDCATATGSFAGPVSYLTGHRINCPIHALIMTEMEVSPSPKIQGIRRLESWDEIEEAIANGHPPFETVADVNHWGPGPNLSPLRDAAEEFALHSVQEERPVPAWEKHRLERKPDHDQIERVPVVVWVWSGDFRHRFQPFPGAGQPVGVEVPIGWSLVPHRVAGVVLRNLWGDELCAGDVLNWAQTGSDSFRLASKSVIEPGDATG
jgi:hypothetical protein